MRGWPRHLEGKKACKDLACLLKNKVWVGRGGLLYFFCLSVSSLFLPKVGKKLHLNWCLLASLQHLGNREAFGLVARGDVGLAPFPPPSQSWAFVLFKSRRRLHEKGRRQQEAASS